MSSIQRILLGATRKLDIVVGSNRPQVERSPKKIQQLQECLNDLQTVVVAIEGVNQESVQLSDQLVMARFKGIVRNLETIVAALHSYDPVFEADVGETIGLLARDLAGISEQIAKLPIISSTTERTETSQKAGKFLQMYPASKGRNVAESLAELESGKEQLESEQNSVLRQSAQESHSVSSGVSTGHVEEESTESTFNEGMDSSTSDDQMSKVISMSELIHKKKLKERIDQLIEEHEAAYKDLSVTGSSHDKIIANRKIALIEDEMAKIESQLNPDQHE